MRAFGGYSLRVLGVRLKFAGGGARDHCISLADSSPRSTRRGCSVEGGRWRGGRGCAHRAPALVSASRFGTTGQASSAETTDPGAKVGTSGSGFAAGGDECWAREHVLLPRSRTGRRLLVVQSRSRT